MKPFTRNIIGLIIGLIVGGFVNMGIIIISGSIIPPPEGAEITTMEGLQESMHLFKPKHFLMPFLAHALGTLVGAFITAMTVASERTKWSVGVGVFFLFGGITNAVVLPSPLWFIIVDITLAYIPMAYLGVIISRNIKNKAQ